MSFISPNMVFAKDEFSPIDLGNDIAAPRASEFDGFIPQPNKATRIDYTFWDGVLYDTLIDLGPSDRVRRVRTAGFFNGKRHVEVGHTSPYRLEGSLVGFAEVFQMRDFRNDIHTYRKELEQLASDIDIASLSRDEQLAFWFNLHNVAVYDIILQTYAKHNLDWVKIDGQRFDEAKVLNIKGVDLSLQDIRQNIVYRNWDDPVVMYGFFHGYIGGPSLRLKAYTASNHKTLLKEGAEEFTNSLRGFEVREGRKKRLDVSQLYSDAAAVYFPNFQNDLRTHFEKYMRPEIFQMANTNEDYNVIKFDTDVSDVKAGKADPQIAGSGSQLIISRTLDGRDFFNRKEPDARTAYGVLIKEAAKKRERLIDLGLWDKSEVTIEDIR